MSQDAVERWAAETNRVTLKECRERYLKALAVVEAARGFADRVANEEHGDYEGECFECGQSWPCFVERLRAALAAFDEEAS